MEIVPKPSRSPGEPPNDDPGDDVREPPLPDEGARDVFPGDTDLIDPAEGGGRINKKAL